MRDQRATTVAPASSAGGVDRAPRPSAPPPALATPCGPSPVVAPSGPRDAELLRAVEAGQLDPEEGIRRVAASGGFPLIDGDRARFVASTPAALAGDHNGWRPAPMERRGPVWVAEVPVAQVSRYKLVRPDGAFVADPLARRYTYDDNGEISLARATGSHLERWTHFARPGLKPREVRIFVPREAPTHHLYVHDGQNLFDPGAPHGGWRLQHQVGPRTLIVGIDTTDERMSELVHTADHAMGREWAPKGPLLADLIREDVQPHVERTYGRPRKVGVMGSSLGGLMSFHMAERFPNAYDFVGSLSGTFGWGALGEHSSGDTLEARYRARAAEGKVHRRPVFYLDSGGGPGGGDNHDVTRRMVGALEEMGHAMGRRLFHWHEPGAAHSEAAWAARAWRPLRIFEKL